MRTTVDRVVQQAAMLEPEAYLDWCDTIDELGPVHTKFGRTVIEYGDETVVCLDHSMFDWPDVPAHTDEHGTAVTSYVDHGPCLISYLILAVNRRAQKAWAFYVNRESRDYEYDPDPVLEVDTAQAVCDAFNKVWYARRGARIAEENKVVDKYLQKARELSPEEYLGWCDTQDFVELYSARYNKNSIEEVQWAVDGIRFKQNACTYDIFAAFCKMEIVFAVEYNTFRRPHGTVPETPLLTGKVADVILQIAQHPPWEE